MRVVSGKYRHRLLEWPNTQKTRPTKDCVRESIFNAIRNDVEGSLVLDLFAGSGSMGIEALSLGANMATFVDNDKVAINTIKHNIMSLQIDNARIINKQYQDALNEFIANNEHFDIIILDPPYAFDDYEGLVQQLIKFQLLSDSGIIILETNREIEVDKLLFSKIKNYKYGKTCVAIMRR